MFTCEEDFARGLRALRWAVAAALQAERGPLLAQATPGPGPAWASAPASGRRGPRILAQAAPGGAAAGSRTHGSGGSAGSAGSGASGGSTGGTDDDGLAVSSEGDQAEAERLIALVDLARNGDSEAFGLLYDHYQPSVYRFLYYKVGSAALAEDLTSETFFRALRSMSSFRWQGKDFGAWLMTIARNLTTDHYKSSKTRLETTTEDMSAHDGATEGPETAVLASVTNEALMEALTQLPNEQQECIIMRFLQGLSIAETAQVLGRSDGAVKQLQLRAVRNLAKLMPEGLR